MPQLRQQSISLAEDGESGLIEQLEFRSRALHRQLEAVSEAKRPVVLLDALDIGAQVLERAGRQGDLESLTKAVERLDEEAKRIVANTLEHVDRSIEKTVSEMSANIQSDDGPMAAVLRRFDLAADGNVIDVFRDLVAATAAKATKQAVKDLSEATQETVERLTKSIAVIEKVAAVEEARLKEAQRGTAKGIEHEINTESLLGELVSVTGDSLDDVSTSPGERGTKKGDKTITPRGGCTIVTEEKCTIRLTESKARLLLEEAMLNRGAQLGMLIVEDESKVPGKQPFHFIDEDKVVVVAERPALRLVYALFRAKAIELASASRPANDAAVAESVITIRQLVGDIARAVERFRLLRTEHTKAAKAIGQAGQYVDEVAQTIGDGVNEIMSVIEGLVAEVDHVADVDHVVAA